MNGDPNQRTTVSREDAQRAAEAFLTRTPGLAGATVRDVWRWDEISRKPLLYNGPPDVERSWVCYLERAGGPFGLIASTIVIVSADRGEVTYAGSAFDEG